MAKKVKAKFIEPMLLLRTDALPNDRDRWQYELKVDGYRAIAFKAGGKLHLRSRNNNDFTVRYAGVLKGLAKLPNETVIDGEIVAFDADGRPSFNALQNQGSTETAIIYFVFDLMVLAGRDVRAEPLKRTPRVARAQGPAEVDRASAIPCGVGRTTVRPHRVGEGRKARGVGCKA